MVIATNDGGVDVGVIRNLISTGVGDTEDDSGESETCLGRHELVGTLGGIDQLNLSHPVGIAVLIKE